MPLDEKALRKPSFTEGFALILADGQEWTFPPPTLRLFPVIGEDGSVDVGGRRSYGDELDRMIDIFAGGEEVEDLERMRIQFGAVVRLLDRNYDLTPADYGALLVYVPNDPENAGRWRRITRALLGLDPSEDESPKPSADGSAGP